MNKSNQLSNKRPKVPIKINKELTNDRLLNFFQLCLDHHMRKGACMSSYIDLKQFKKITANLKT